MNRNRTLSKGLLSNKAQGINLLSSVASYQMGSPAMSGNDQSLLAIKRRARRGGEAARMEDALVVTMTMTRGF